MTRKELKTISIGTTVLFEGERVSVIKISNDGDSLLIKQDNGDIYWKPYYLIELQ